jgi:lipopolysaccharide/colanic/teichoic acid biosynthesis glycosyltransferase
VWQVLQQQLSGGSAMLELWGALAILAAWSICFPRELRPAVETSAWKDAARLFTSSAAFSAAVALGVKLALKATNSPLRALAFEFVIAILCMELGNTLRRCLARSFVRHDNRPRAVIVGSGRRASRAWREVRLNFDSSLELLGFVDNRDRSEMAPDIANRMLCTLDELRSAIILNRIDRIYIAMPFRTCYDQIETAIDVAVSLGVKVYSMEDVYSTSNRQMVLGEQIFINLSPKRTRLSGSHMGRRMLDIAVSLIGMIVFFPVGLVIALMIKLSSPGPVFVSEQRLGLNGKRLKMYRFRTFALPSGVSWTPHPFNVFQEAKPYTTTFGDFLKRTSIDEIAQFWNVLTGEMSLVGPRPMSIGDAYNTQDSLIRDRLRVKPGMTGLWQVSGRSALGREHSIDLDVQYLRLRSLSLDLKILLRTVPAVFRKTGAA